MSPALSRYLKDFGAELPPLPETTFENLPVFPDIPAEPLVDIEAERREAYADGQEAATLTLSQKHQAEMDALATAHRDEIETLRACYEDQAAERIAAGLTQVAVMLGQAVSVEAAAVLAPVMTEALMAKSLADLAGLVQASILDGAAGPITVEGPLGLFESLHARMGDGGAMLRHVETQDVDLTVTIGEAVLVTRMSAWAVSLRKILE
jgi:hypothetical protein